MDRRQPDRILISFKKNATAAEEMKTAPLLTEEEMAEIAKLDKGERYYNRTDEQLAGFAAWRPSFEMK